MQKYLQSLSINTKLLLLLLNAFLLFPYIQNEDFLIGYSVFLILLIFSYSLIYAKIKSFKSLKGILSLWLIGLFFFFIFSLIFLLNNWEISPGINLTTLRNKIIYLTLYPIRILGVFLIGFTFIEIISPIEFLRYGQVGYYLCYLFRSFQVSKDEMLQNKVMMEMRGQIPLRFNRFSDYALFFKNAPLIIALTIRNMMLWLFWSSHGFEKFKKSKIKKQRGTKE